VEAAKARDREVAEAAAFLPRVKMVDVITGQFDVIVLVEAEDLRGVWETVDTIQALAGVVKTTTSLVVE
ncbi:MAG: Lrp/AsnC ligand binding domain-containing protein, partial [Candidatus Methylomirabilales bacterium]